MTTYKILVADDEPALLNSLRIRLSSQGYEVSCANDAYQAVALAGKEKPDLLILDIHMPAGDGFSVQDRVRRMPNMGRIPIIYISGDRSPEVLDRVRDVKAGSLLKKPFDTAKLLETVRQALGLEEKRSTTWTLSAPQHETIPDFSQY